MIRQKLERGDPSYEKYFPHNKKLQERNSRNVYKQGVCRQRKINFKKDMEEMK